MVLSGYQAVNFVTFKNWHIFISFIDFGTVVPNFILVFISCCSIFYDSSATIKLYAFCSLPKLFQHEYAQLPYNMTQYHFNGFIKCFSKLLSNKWHLLYSTGKNQPRHRICSHRTLTGNG